MDNSNLSFAFQHAWWFVPMVVIIAALGLLGGKRGGNSVIQFSSLYILSRLGRRVSTRAGGYRFPFLLGLVLLLGFIALARPQSLRTSKLVKESGIEMILAIDVSRSMLVKDMVLLNTPVNRLTAAKSVIRNFVRGRPMDRIGLVAFAGRPYLASPITLDHAWIQDSLDNVKVGLVEDGTAIGSAIAASAKRLDRREAKSKVIVLLTDGANNSGNLSPITAAELANTLGVKIYTIAVGTPGRHTIPTANGPMPLDQEFDPETLQAIAQMAGGRYFRAEGTQNLEQIFAEIDTLEKTEREARVRVEPTDFFPVAVSMMFMLAVFRMVANETFLRRYP